MLRTSLPLSRRLVLGSIGPRTTSQLAATVCRDNNLSRRSFADTKKPDPNTKPSIHDSDTIVLPGSQSQTAKGPTPPAPGPVASVSPTTPSPATPSSDTTILPENIPLVPPPPPAARIQTAPPTSIPPITARDVSPSPPSSSPPVAPSQPPQPPPWRKPRRFRNFLLSLFLLGGLSYAGAVYYSLVSDNFHDFFTEYIPFGEQAVLYFEERDYRRRFPNAQNTSNRSSSSIDSGNKITIPSKSGLSWRVMDQPAQGSDLGTKGPHMSALRGDKPNPAVEDTKQTPSNATGSEKSKAVDQAKKGALASGKTEAKPPIQQPKDDPEPQQKQPGKPTLTPATAPSSPKIPEKPPTRSPEVNEPSVIMPTPRIDPLKIDNANEPIVQDLVKIVNDIITVVNADNASGKFSSSISKAKSELASVGSKILALKETEQKRADEKIKSTQTDFDQAARELVRRLEEEMRDQEARWKDEFETERDRISQSYQDRLENELSRSQKVSDQRVRNQLLEQAISLKKDFLSSVTSRVETERSGRLSKLSELSTSVSELEQLTSDWNAVINANLQTQHLQVAIEAVRSALATADRPKPFVRELSALKDLAADNTLVNAAIASINPTAYQRGVATPAQLIDRFRRVAAEVRKASLLPEDAGVASHAASWALSKVLFRKQGMTVGDDVESVLTRTETLLEEGKLDEAAREMNGLGGWAKRLSLDWLGEVRRALEVRQAMDVIATEARLQSLRVD